MARIRTPKKFNHNNYKPSVQGPTWLSHDSVSSHVNSLGQNGPLFHRSQYTQPTFETSSVVSPLYGKESIYETSNLKTTRHPKNIVMGPKDTRSPRGPLSFSYDNMEHASSMHQGNIKSIKDGNIFFHDENLAWKTHNTYGKHGEHFLGFKNGQARYSEGYDPEKRSGRILNVEEAHAQALQHDSDNHYFSRKKQNLYKDLRKHDDYRHLGDEGIKDIITRSKADINGDYSHNAKVSLEREYNSRFSDTEKHAHKETKKAEEIARNMEIANLKKIHGDNVTFTENGHSFKEGYNHKKVSSQHEKRINSGFNRELDNDILNEAYAEQRGRLGYNTKSTGDVWQEAWSSHLDQHPDRVPRSVVKQLSRMSKPGSPKSLNEQWNSLYTGTHSDNVAAQGVKKNASMDGKLTALEQAIKDGKLEPEEIEQHVKGVGSKFGYKGDKLDEFVDKHIQNGNVDIQGLRAYNNKHAYDINMWDKAVGNKVPQMAAGGLGLAWMVSNMASAKGQQTNGQLYGQQTPYY